MNIEKCNGCTKNILIKTSYIAVNKSDKIINLDNRKYTPLCKNCLERTISKFQNFIDSADKSNVSYDAFSDIELFIAESGIWIKKSDWKKKISATTKILKQKKREEMLMKKIKDLKIDYGPCRVSEGFIKYGISTLDNVVQYFIDVQNKKDKRVCKLISYLDAHNMCYNNNIPAYAKYIDQGGDLDRIIRDAKIETFLIDETEYLNLLKKYDSDTAKEIALMNYVQNGGNHEIAQKYIREKTTIIF